MTKGFVNLHNHSEYSLLDGYAHIEEYVRRANMLGQPAVALTDHGNMYGIYELIKTCRDLSKTIDHKGKPQDPIYVKPIPGIEAYMAPQNPDGAKCREKVFYGKPDQVKLDVAARGSYLHLTLLAYNSEGFHNLIRLSSESFKPENMLSKPRMDMKMLERWNGGLIATTGCPSGEIQTRLRLGQTKEAYEYAERMMDLFPDRYFVEIMQHDMSRDLERAAIPQLLKLAEDLDLPLLATNDAHYANPSDARHQEEMLCIQSKSNMSTPTERDEALKTEKYNVWANLPKEEKRGGLRFAFDGTDYYLKSEEEMRAAFPDEDFPGAVDNTVKIAEMVDDWWVDAELPADPKNGLLTVKTSNGDELVPSAVVAAECTAMHDADKGKSYGTTPTVHFEGLATIKKNRNAAANRQLPSFAKNMDEGDAVSEDETPFHLTEEKITDGLQDLINDEKLALGPFDLSLDKTLRPVVPIPDGYTEEEWFQKQINDGFIKKRLNAGDDRETLEESKRRIAVEYPVFAKNNFIQYMLVVQDYINWARRNGIVVGPGRGCFLGDNEILMEDGLTRRISEVVPGAYVVTSEGSLRVVENRFEFDVKREDCVKLFLDDGSTIECTADHKILTEDGEWLRADSLLIGSRLHSPIQHGGVALVDRTHFEYTGKVYDLQVAGVHNYTVSGVTVHNSVGGSEIAYLMNISDTDPIRHDLLFERFLNPERVSPPDVDTDFQASRRDEVLEYVKQKYGDDKIKNIVAISREKTAASLKDMARAYGVSFADSTKATSLLPKVAQGVTLTVDALVDPNSQIYNDAMDFRAFTVDNPDPAKSKQWKQVFDAARAIEGRVRGVTNHACGVIMSDVPISEHVPTAHRPVKKGEKPGSQNPWGETTVQWGYEACEAMGLIKMDFLALQNINIIGDTIDNILRMDGALESDLVGDKREKTIEHMRSEGFEIPDMHELNHGPMDDSATYEMLGRGESVGVFQLSSDGTRELLRRMKPKVFDDLSATIALYRPGPMAMNAHIDYADRRNGTQKIKQIDPAFNDSPVSRILEPTMAEIVYQEQIMQISQQLCGFTKGQSDALRKAIGHKKIEVMQQMEGKFKDGAERNGYPSAAVNKLWDIIVAFASYAFNKCLHGEVKVQLADNTRIKIKDLYVRWTNGDTDVAINSMWPDGSIHPHKIKSIEKMPEEKVVWKVYVKYANGESDAHHMIMVTSNHRLLTTDGYHTIDDGGIRIGSILIEDPEWTTRPTESQREARKTNALRCLVPYARSEKGRSQSREWMSSYQSTLTFEDRSKHQKRIQEKHPNRTVPAIRAMRKAIESMRALGGTKYGMIGHGIRTPLSDGRICDSIVEALAGEYLLARGVDFELHKEFSSINGTQRFCDFYANGLYFEMDGMDRGEQWFRDRKYGDSIPFVYMTPFDYKDKIDEALMSHHVENGMVIYKIEPYLRHSDGTYGKSTVYDIEMEDDGPSNFIANGIVSHNSHSAAYALTSYDTAYLKCHYPSAFMAALISGCIGDKDKVRKLLKECEDIGLKVGGVNVNKSMAIMAPVKKTSSDDADIIYGLTGVKHVSMSVAEAIIQARADNGGSFADFDDFMSKVPTSALSKTVLENLAKAGAFDCFGVSRRAVYVSVDKLIAFYKNEAKAKAVGQGDLFSMLDSEDIEPSRFTLPDIADWPFLDRITMERELIGLSVSADPLSNAGAGLNELMKDDLGLDDSTNVIQYRSIEQLSEGARGTFRTIAWIDEATKKRTKDGRQWMISVLVDKTGQLEASASADVYEKISKTCAVETNHVYEIELRVTAPWSRDGSPATGRRYSIVSMREIELTVDGKIPLWLRMYDGHDEDDDLKTGCHGIEDPRWPRLLDVLRKHPGDLPVLVDVRDQREPDSSKAFRIVDTGICIDSSDIEEVKREIESVIGTKYIGRWPRG